MTTRYEKKKGPKAITKHGRMKAKVNFRIEKRGRSIHVRSMKLGKTGRLITSSYTGSPDSEAIASHLNDFSYRPELKNQVLEKIKRY